MSFRLVCVGAASLLCLFASASSAAGPTRGENANAVPAAQSEEFYPQIAQISQIKFKCKSLESCVAAPCFSFTQPAELTRFSGVS